MTILQALLLSLVEGITEFLPISSTGHLILTAQLLKIPQTEFVKTFEIFIQLGAISAVALLYWRKIIANKNLMKVLLISFLPTGILGFFLYKIIKEHLLDNVWVTVVSLLLGGIILLFIDSVFSKKKQTTSPQSLTVTQALIIGLCQSVSMIPGVSRAAATIIGGMGVGMSKVDAVEYSFLLALPTMTAATGYDLLKSHGSIAQSDYTLLAIGFIGAFISAYIVISAFIQFVQRHTFKAFGIYRILLALAYITFFLQ